MLRDILTGAQQTVLELLSRTAEVRSLYLAGGTAFALHLGHRRSRAFDFFRPKEFVPQDLVSARPLVTPGGEPPELTESQLLRCGPASQPSLPRGDYPLIRPLHESPWGLSLGDSEDIAAMRLAAIASRGPRKDFIGLCVYALPAY